jgi:hypothetical protein
MGRLGIHGRLCEREIKAYLDSPDNWTASLGAEMLRNAQPMYSESLITGIFDEMERFGPNCFPYTTGEALASYLMHDPSLHDRVVQEYFVRRDTFREALLHTFVLMKDLPPGIVELITLSAASSADRVKDAALIAMGNCPADDRRVFAILHDELQSPQWWRRGNATHSLAKLKVKDEATLKRIEELVFDLEPGDDWTVREAAIEALGDYGPDARGAVPSLVKVLHEELAAGLEEDTGYASLADLASTALGKIGDSSPMTVEILGEVIKKGSDRSAPAAITALGKFGEAARPALSFIERYIARNDSMYDEEKVLSYVEALEKIAGPGSPELLKYLKRLQKSEIGDIREFARQAAHAYTGHP